MHVLRAAAVCRRLHLALGLALLGATLGVQAANLRWAAQNDVLTLDPHAQDHATTNAILGHVYEGLTRRDAAYRPEPSLATGWTYLSPNQVRFTLRRGVKFHDGSAFTADDVLFSFERMRHPNGNKQTYLSGIKELRKVDEHTVDLILESPTPMLLQNVASVSIMSKAWATKNNTTVTQNFRSKEVNFATLNAMGTGPFVLKAWQPSQRISFVAHKDWWDKPAGNVTELSYLPIASDQTRAAALLSGEADLLTDVPTQDVARLRSDSKLKVIEGSEVRTIFFALDQGNDELRGSNVKGRNPFKDKRVREAMNLALDRVALQRVIMRGLSVPAALMVAPGVNGYAADLDAPLKPDPERARKLLAEAGYPEGFEVPLHCPNNRYVNDEELCQAVVPMWLRIGIKAKLVVQPFSLHSQTFQRGESPLYMLGWGVSTFDAQYALQAWGHTRTAGADGSFNYGGLSDAKLDQLINAAKSESDVAKRNGFLREALLRVRDEHFFVPLHHQVRPWVTRQTISIPHRANDQPQAWTAVVK